MNTRRKIILRELGLTPLWRMRQNTLIADSPPETADAGITQSDALKQPGEQNPEIGQLDWTQLASAVAGCTACPLRQTCTQTVFGVGDQNADWLYIGEGPGAREDALGEPFVGQAGKLLDNMLASIGVKRGQNVYITNIVKCRPPNNRNPSDQEARQCAPYLARQIELIKPKLIVALGKVAAQNLLGSNDSIANLRGKIHDYSGIPLMVTYHPAYLLRALPEKAKAWKDLCMARAFMESQS
jgi:DNA polymerase